MAGTRFTLEVRPVIPNRLKRLEELANDLLYSWDSAVRSLFQRLDVDLWNSCGHNPKVFLRRVSQQNLALAEKDRVYIQDYNRVLSVYDTYLEDKIKPEIDQLLDPDRDLVAYFCAEFGFHESFPIYSGGLGILAGDHCKAASDLSIPFVAVGLLYREGYFHQTIDGYGNQVAHNFQTDSADLPIVPAIDTNGKTIHIEVALPGSKVALKVWKAKAGHITLYLLDSDLPENNDSVRSITHQLYGGDIDTRIQQEIVLGIGGVRALRAVGLSPTVWHINEGHAAFQILERCREYVQGKLDFDTALEIVAAATIFTTHTPVPAGHDIFDHQHISTYFNAFVGELGIDEKKFLALGKYPGKERSFNMTALALRCSRFHNGVSRIHGSVASQMEGYVWPEIPAHENPIGYVTNGVHVPTFLAREWVSQFDIHFGGGWRNELLNEEFWEKIDDIPDHSFWSTRQSLKTKLFEEVYKRVSQQYRRNGASPTQIERLTQHIASQDPDVLTVGFARRFATYKRALLLFSDPERLARLLNDPDRPVVFIFAGKAHPHDIPGQQLIKSIHEFAHRPEYEGKIILVEGYDLALARKLVTGVDVWLNTPQYPLEASGTSGEKAGINGVINLSVLDGWWGEGYNGENGWAISPHEAHIDELYRNREEANELMDLLESQVVALYYKRNGHGYSEEWVKKSKNSLKSLMPRFNAQRMVMDYVRQYYSKAKERINILCKDNCQPAKQLAEWKKNVASAWPKVSIRRLDSSPDAITAGETLPVEIAVNLNGLQPDDVFAECLVGIESEINDFILDNIYKMEAFGTTAAGETKFKLDLQSQLPGLQHYKIRIYPYNNLLSRRFELGLMRWL
jgi:glycogen phosphorylase